jgi:hypothetical protein
MESDVLEVFRSRSCIGAALSKRWSFITGNSVDIFFEVATFVDNNGSESESTMIKYHQLKLMLLSTADRVYLTNLDFNPSFRHQQHRC